MAPLKKYFTLHMVVGVMMFLVIILVAIDKLGISNFASQFVEDIGKIILREEPEPHLVSGGGNVVETIWTLFLASMLGGIITYRERHSHHQFSILQTHMILSVSAAMMMMIIGSEIARAFGIFGAAGIVRYRHRLVSPREASTLIIALGVGLACGTGLYVLAIVATLLVVFILNIQFIFPQRVLRTIFGPRYTMQLKCMVSSEKENILLENLEKLFLEKNIDYVIASIKYRTKEETDITVETSVNSQKQQHEFSQSLLELGVENFSWKGLPTE